MFRQKFFILLAAISLVFLGGAAARATTNIIGTTEYHFAWEDMTGWWNFYDTNTVEVTNTKLTGYASSSFGAVSLDCATSPNGNICTSGNDYYGVCNGPATNRGPEGNCPDGNAGGVLYGWEWNDEIGWISFNCADIGACATSNYKVQIDGSGVFSGYAWNDVVGWISFNCANYSGCGTSDYRVATNWDATSTVGYLESSIFDTEKTEGSLLNNIVWQGTDPGAESCVSFQIAASQSPSGPWSYIGPSGTGADYYGATCETAPNGGVGCAPDDAAICINKNDFINYRYLRYKVRLQSTLIQESPLITDIILNWSP